MFELPHALHTPSLSVLWFLNFDLYRQSCQLTLGLWKKEIQQWKPMITVHNQRGATSWTPTPSKYPAKEWKSTHFWKTEWVWTFRYTFFNLSNLNPSRFIIQKIGVVFAIKVFFVVVFLQTNACPFTYYCDFIDIHKHFYLQWIFVYIDRLKYCWNHTEFFWSHFCW